MIALLDSADLIMEATDRPLARTGRVRFVAPSGEQLGSASERVSALRALNRVFSQSPGFGPAQLEVADAAGNRVLDVAKGRHRPFGGCT